MADWPAALSDDPPFKNWQFFQSSEIYPSDPDLYKTIDSGLAMTLSGFLGSVGCMPSCPMSNLLIVFYLDLLLWVILQSARSWHRLGGPGRLEVVLTSRN